MGPKIRGILKKLAKKEPHERKNLLNKCNSVVFKDIKKICSHACHDAKLKNSSIIKKNKKYKNIIRRIANSKTIARVKRLLLKYNIQGGSGIFSILGGLVLPLVSKLIADAV